VSDTSDTRRDAIHKLLQELGAEEGAGEGSLLTGWALVTSWVDPDGETWLTKAHAATIPQWTATGMHHEALFGHWPAPDDE
jgi:hypothetical protein